MIPYISARFALGPRLAALSLLLPVLLWAQAPATGIIEGRVVNPATGDYTEFVRVRIDGTELAALTDANGRFLIARVPAGRVTVRAFYTGATLSRRRSRCRGSVQANFAWMEERRSGDGVVKLQPLQVSASKEMSSAAIAINTQRFSESCRRR